MAGPVDPKALDELVRASGVPYRENSRSWIFSCPRCGKDDKLYMFKGSGRFCCWVCKETVGFQGRPEFALAELLGQPVRALRKKLYGEEAPQAVQYLDVQLRDFFGEDDDVDEDASWLEPVQWPVDYYPIDHRFSTRGRQYLEGRGIGADMAKRYDLRYCPPERRVAFPIASRGVLYGWQGRFIGPTEYEDPETGDVFKTPKVVTTKGLKKELTLMFADRLTGSAHAVLCEGPVDALKADLCGGNVATMGKAVSRAQIELLRNAGVQRLYIGLDPDAASEILRIARELHDLELYLLRPPAPAKDLGEMSAEQVFDLFQNAGRITGAHLFAFIDDYDNVLRRQFRLSLRRRQGRAR